MIAHAPNPASAIADRGRAADDGRCHVAELEAPVGELAPEERSWDDGEGDEHEAQRRDREEVADARARRGAEATTPAKATPSRVSPRPIPAAIQNTVERSSSSIVGRWIRAAPSAGSVNSRRKLAATSASDGCAVLARLEQPGEDDDDDDPRPLLDGVREGLPQGSADDRVGKVIRCLGRRGVVLVSRRPRHVAMIVCGAQGVMRFAEECVPWDGDVVTTTSRYRRDRKEHGGAGANEVGLRPRAGAT